MQERRSFHRFQYCTVPALAGGSETGFWTKLVLKVGQEEPVVRNAIIALATLHEDYQDRCGKYTVQLIEDPSYRHALGLYGASLRGLNQRLNQPSRTNARLAIISSILFTCFEVLRRNNMAAVIHYQQGMRELIRQMNLPQGEDTSLTPYSPQEYRTSRANFRQIPENELDELLRVFARYDIQACTFSKPRAEPLNFPINALPRVQPTDLTLAQVRNHLDNLLVSVYQLVKSDLKMFRYWDSETVPLEWRLQKQHAIGVLDAWLAALEHFFQLHEKNLGLAELRSLLGLRLQIRTAVIMLKVSIDCGPESTFDGFNDEFEDMVSRVEGMTSKFQMVNVLPLELERTPFTMELGVVHPLFFVACKSRNWSLRRRAIAQLKKAGKEGVWEGPIMAVLGERIAVLEEEGVQEGGLIPEANRFHEIKKNVDYDKRLVLWEGNKVLDIKGRTFTVHREALPF